MFRTVLSTVLLSTLAIVSPLAVQAQQGSPAPRSVTVTATGSVSAEPDIVIISAGVRTSAGTAQDALRKNSAAMRRVIRQLKDSGIRPQDIATQNLSVQPEYRRTSDNTRPPEVVGYRVVNSVRIRVRNIAILGEVLDRIVELGSNTVGGIQFKVSKAEQLKDDARERAIENARRRARLFARAAGAELGQVLTIQESSVGYAPRPTFSRSRIAAESAAPVEPGSQDLTATVTVTWELQ